MAVGVIKSVSKTEKSGGKVTKVSLLSHFHASESSFTNLTSRLLKRPLARNRGLYDIKAEKREVFVVGDGPICLVTIRHLASWFILALSSLHFCHTHPNSIPQLWRLDIACGNGLTSLGDDSMRSFSFVDGK